MKDLEINKELVIEVLGKEISQIQIIGNTLNYIIPNVESQEDDELVYIDLGLNINIYEFAFKCKEWALTQGIYIFSSSTSCSIFRDGTLIGISSDENNEVKAIIKACNWVLKEL